MLPSSGAQSTLKTLLPCSAACSQTPFFFLEQEVLSSASLAPHWPPCGATIQYGLNCYGVLPMCRIMYKLQGSRQLGLLSGGGERPAVVNQAEVGMSCDCGVESHWCNPQSVTI